MCVFKKRWKCYVQAVFCNPKIQSTSSETTFPSAHLRDVYPSPNPVLLFCCCTNNFRLPFKAKDLFAFRLQILFFFAFHFKQSHSPYNFTDTAELSHLTISMCTSYLNDPKQMRKHFECNCHSCRFIVKWNGWEGGLNPLFCIFYTSSPLFVML